MNKDTINIDGKTYVRQDKPTVNPADVANAKKQVSRIKKLSLLGSCILGFILVLIGIDTFVSFIISGFACIISIVIQANSIEKNFSADVIQEAFPERTKIPESSQSSFYDNHRHSPRYSNLPGNINYRD